MDRLSITACPLCGAKQMEQTLTCVDRYASGETFEVYRCTSCGFLFTQDAPGEAEISRYYETPDYISHSDTRRGLMNRIYHHVRSYMLGRKARLVERLANGRKGRLLDIGTGTGYFPHTMQQRGWQVEAVEQSASAREFARNHFGLDVKPDHAWESLGQEQFDVITLWHVMEHLPHLDAVWERLHRMLASGGSLVVAVPNCSSYDARYYGADWAAYDVPRHLWHFTPDSMNRWAAKHQFRVVETHPMPFDAFYVSMLTEKELGHPCSFVRGFWTGLRAWVAAATDQHRSSSIIYVLKV